MEDDRVGPRQSERASVHRFAAQLDCVSVRVSESEVQMVAVELKRPVDHCAVPERQQL
jgi:hypothetical protein